MLYICDAFSFNKLSITQIEALVAQRTQHRMDKEYDKADIINQIE